MPGVTVVTHVLPVTIIVEVVDAWDVVGNVVIARGTTIRIVVVGVVEIGIVIAIAAIVFARIAIAEMVVEQSAGLARIKRDITAPELPWHGIVSTSTLSMRLFPPCPTTWASPLNVVATALPF